MTRSTATSSRKEVKRTRRECRNLRAKCAQIHGASGPSIRGEGDGGSVICGPPEPSIPRSIPSTPSRTSGGSAGHLVKSSKRSSSSSRGGSFRGPTGGPILVPAASARVPKTSPFVPEAGVVTPASVALCAGRGPGFTAPLRPCSASLPKTPAIVSQGVFHRGFRVVEAGGIEPPSRDDSA